jgi:transposase
VALHLVKMACERPDDRGRSLSFWDCREMARQLAAEGVVTSISPDTVRRVLEHHHLKPWRHHLWLSPKVPRDEAFAAAVQEVSDLYTRPLGDDEVVLCVDEKTSLQPRPRKSPTLAAQPKRPVRVEHEYGRCGALNLFAAFDTRTGKVYGRTAERKRQVEFIAFLEQLDREIPATIKTVHVVLDNLRMHKGKQVQAWLATHPRFVFHHPRVHCSWMNQVEQWFSILQRKRLRIADFADKAALAERLQAFITEWNQVAHPFRWSTKSVAKVMAKCQRAEVSREGETTHGGMISIPLSLRRCTEHRSPDDRSRLGAAGEVLGSEWGHSWFRERSGPGRDARDRYDAQRRYDDRREHAVYPAGVQRVLRVESGPADHGQDGRDRRRLVTDLLSRDGSAQLGLGQLQFQRDVHVHAQRGSSPRPG